MRDFGVGLETHNAVSKTLRAHSASQAVDGPQVFGDKTPRMTLAVQNALEKGDDDATMSMVHGEPRRQSSAEGAGVLFFRNWEFLVQGFGFQTHQKSIETPSPKTPKTYQDTTSCTVYQNALDSSQPHEKQANISASVLSAHRSRKPSARSPSPSTTWSRKLPRTHGSDGASWSSIAPETSELEGVEFLSHRSLAVPCPALGV